MGGIYNTHKEKFMLSLMVQWWRICFPIQGTRLWSLVHKLRSLMLQSNEGTTTTESTCCNKDSMQQKRKKEKFIKRKWTARRTAIKQTLIWGFPVGSMAKNLPAMQEMRVWSSGLGRSSGEGNVYPFQYSCRENPMDRGAWKATVLRVAKSQT